MARNRNFNDAIYGLDSTDMAESIAAYALTPVAGAAGTNISDYWGNTRDDSQLAKGNTEAHAKQDVKILRKEPTRPHVQLGEVRAEPSSDSVSAQKIELALQNAAAKMGADAVVIVYDRTQVTGAMVTGPWYGRSFQTIVGRVIIGVAIKYTGEGS